jgi:catechol 2,3-dioxygenase-like lactoylglutathione lyase family enzyme
MLKTKAILKDSPIFSTFAVDDVAKAKRFYGDTLGLDVRDAEMEGLIEIHSGNRPPVTVYPKPDHKPAVFTVLNFPVDDVEQVVDSLTAAGVRFEHYDTPDMKTNQKGIMHGNGPDIAWFRDPAGNILSVIGKNGS